MPLNEEQKLYIKDHYHNNSTREIAKYLGISTKQITIYAGNAKLSKNKSAIQKNKLSEEHEQLIYLHYEYGDLDWLSKELNKNKHAIQEWARKRGLKRKIDISRNGDMSSLISGTLESFYWLGFIAADGYIYTNGHLMVSQSEKDKDNVVRFAEYLKTKLYLMPSKTSGYKSNSDHYRVNICDKVIGCKIRKMFNVQSHSPKTYTGISLDFIKTEDQAAAFLCGFIDGDGSLNNSKSYHIQCHKSWFETFKVLVNKLPSNMDNISIRLIYRKDKDKTFSHMDLRKKSSKLIREFAKKHNLPVSKRKFPD
jgi:transposase